MPQRQPLGDIGNRSTPRNASTNYNKAFERLHRFQEDFRALYDRHAGRGVDVERVIRGYFEDRELELGIFNHYRTSENITYSCIRTPEVFMKCLGLITRCLDELDVRNILY